MHRVDNTKYEVRRTRTGLQCADTKEARQILIIWLNRTVWLKADHSSDKI